MKFISVLLNEGRKDDIRKKYSNKFDTSILDEVLNDPDLLKFNHKYTDFLLKHIDPNNFDLDYTVGVGLIKDFDKYQSSLSKKDINQYTSFNELERVLEPIIEKSIEKDMSGQVEKIYEDDTFLILIPKTKEASCKYGSNTKWCVTMKTTNHFENYTKDNQLLYFIINKKNTFDKEYSKIAVHYNKDGQMSIWDSQDDKLTTKQVSLVKYALPNLFNAIESDSKKRIQNDQESYLRKVFNFYSTYDDVIYNFMNTTYTIFLSVSGFELMEDGMSDAYLKISVVDIKNKVVLTDNYILLVTYHIIDNDVKVNISVSESGEDEESFGTSVDLGLDNTQLSILYGINHTHGNPYLFSSNILKGILMRVKYKITTNEILINKLVGPNVWTPSRGGYKFKSSDKGMVGKLVKYLDDGYIESTKLDFLTYIGKLDKKIENNKPLYSIKGKNDFRPSSDFRGHFSTFFAAAKSAGIIQYDRVGNKIVMRPGKNFEAFKSGTLKAL